MKRKFLVTCLAIIMTFGFCSSAMAYETSTVQESELTLGTIQEHVRMYLETAHPDIVVGSEDYIEYLSAQLMEHADTELEKMPEYKQIRLYASRYLALANAAAISRDAAEDMNIVNPNQVIFMLPESELNKTVSEVRNEVEQQNMIDRALEAEYRNRPNMLASYNATAAAKYAQTYAMAPNSPAYNYYITGDCTNFASQALHAGGISMKKPSSISTGIVDTTKYWYSRRRDQYNGSTFAYYYDQSSSWIRVVDLYAFCRNNGGGIINCSTKSMVQEMAQIGDIVQLSDEGSFHHSIIITSGSKGNWKYCGHSYNQLDKPINDIGADAFRIIRF